MSELLATPELLSDPPPGMINAYGNLLKLDARDSLFLGSHDYEVYETKLVLGIVRPGDVAVDVGAMIGYYTLILARGVGPGGRVYAFEPDPDSFRLLEENVAMNGYEHVTCRRAIVGDRSGSGSLFRAPDEHRGDNRAYAHRKRAPTEVEMVALDEVVEAPVDIVKVDVQGFEGRVLEGMPNLIAGSDQLTLLVEFSPELLDEAGTDPVEFLGSLREQGLRLFEIDEREGSLRGVHADRLVESFLDEDGAFGKGYTNLLCVKGCR